MHIVRVPCFGVCVPKMEMHGDVVTRRGRAGKYFTVRQCVHTPESDCKEADDLIVSHG